MKKLTLMLAFVLLVTGPALAADRVIYNGSDLWMTKGDGTTFADFAFDPIPAGFFCSKSAAFTDRIVFKGVPLVTGVAGGLGATDTIVQRLDDAAFNKRGVAVTRIQVRALSLESVAPLKTACGLYKAVVSLEGEQPITRMRIVREGAMGGHFLAPLALNVKITFVPLGLAATNEKLEIRQSITFDATPNPWSSERTGAMRQQKGFVLVDTDGDRVADTYLPGTSNFAAGRGVMKAVAPQEAISEEEQRAWHTRPTHAHVTNPPPPPPPDDPADPVDPATDSTLN